MRYSIPVALLCLSLATSANAGYRLSIYSDEALTQSSIDDHVPRIVSLYVVETGFDAATGVRFATEPSVGFTGTWLGDASSYLTLGSTPTDFSVAYGACLPPPILVVTMSYQLYGTSSVCSELRIVPPDGLPCAISPDTGCNWVESWICELDGLRVNCPVATQASTWGRVKALYRN